MAQYDVAKVVYEQNGSVTTSEIKRHVDVTEGTIRFNLKHLKKKGYLVEEDGMYNIASGISEDDIKDLKPSSLDDID